MGFLFIMMYFLVVYLVIQISTFLFKLTGLEHEISQFQVISMLTGTGFTTGESELIITHPIRRKLSAFLILFGVFSLAVIISSISTILANEFRTYELLGLVIALLVVFFLIRRTRIRRFLKKKFSDTLRNSFHLHELPVREVLYLEEDDLIIDIPLHADSAFIDRSVAELSEKDDDITLLYITRGEFKYRKNLHEKVLKEGDTLFIYGNKQHIKDKFYEELKKKKNVKTEKIPVNL